MVYFKIVDEYLFNIFSFLCAKAKRISGVFTLLLALFELSCQFNMHFVKRSVRTYTFIHHMHHLVKNLLNHWISQTVFRQHLKAWLQLTLLNFLLCERLL